MGCKYIIHKDGFSCGTVYLRHYPTFYRCVFVDHNGTKMMWSWAESERNLGRGWVVISKQQARRLLQKARNEVNTARVSAGESDEATSA